VLARERHLLIPLLFNFFLHGMTLTSKGDYEAALALFREGLSFAERVGDEAIHHRLLNCLGWLHAELGGSTGPSISIAGAPRWAGVGTTPARSPTPR
jgi:hypothetical protein